MQILASSTTAPTEVRELFYVCSFFADTWLGPAPESFTDKIYEETKNIVSYRIAAGLHDIDLTRVAYHRFAYVYILSSVLVLSLTGDSPW
jgi:hypothetical protein